MRKVIINGITAIIIIMAAVTMINAQVLMNYQGRLTGLDGQPVADDSYTITFSLWDDSTGGTQVWMETHSAVQTNDGMFTVVLGSDSTLYESVFENEPIFLQIMIAPDNYISPRTRLTSVPSAAYAKKVVGDIETGEGSLELKSSSGNLAFSMTTAERGQTNFQMYNISPGYAGQTQLNLSTGDYGGGIELYPTGEIQFGPAFTIGLEPSPFRYPYLSFYDPTGSFPNDPAIKMGVEPSPFIEMTEQSGDYGDRPFIRMGIEPSPWRQGYIAFKNPDVGPPPKLMEIGINDSTGDWGSEIDMYLAHPPEYPSPKQILSIGSAPSTGANIKMFNPQPEPPARLMELGVITDGSEWSSGIDMYLVHPPEYPSPKQILSIGSAPSSGASIKMFNPQPEPPRVYFEVDANTDTGPSMSFHDDVGKVMGFDPSPFNEGFSISFMDPVDDGKILEIAANHNSQIAKIDFIAPGNDDHPALELEVTPVSSSFEINRYDDVSHIQYPGISLEVDNSAETSNFRLIAPGNDDINGFEITADELANAATFRLIDPADDGRSLVEISGGPSTGASIYMFNPQPEPPAKLFDLSVPIGVKSSDDVVMKLTSADGQYVTKLTPGRVKVGHSTNDLYPRSELNAGADSITFFIQGNTAVLDGPPITMLSSSSEAKMGIGTMTPNENLVVGNDLGAYSGTRLVVGGSNAGTNTGFVFGENSNYRGWMLWNVDDDLIELGTKEGAGTYGSTIILKSGTVGIGGQSAGSELHVNGNICYTGTIGTCSDRRYKTDINKLNNALDKVLRLRGVSFNWQKEQYPEYKFSENEQVGLIAQEVKDILPQAVSKDNNGYYNVDYTKITPLLIEAIKELKTENDKLKKRLDKIESQ